MSDDARWSERALVWSLPAWIVAEGLAGTAEGELLAGLCARLVAAGVPLQRAFVGIDTLHPIVEGRAVRWQRDRGTAEASEYRRVPAYDDTWLRSPLYALEAAGASRLRRRLGADYRHGEFPLLDELVAAGTTDYLACRTAIGPPAEGFLDCVTAPGAATIWTALPGPTSPCSMRSCRPWRLRSSRSRSPGARTTWSRGISAGTPAGACSRATSSAAARRSSGR